MSILQVPPEPPTELGRYRILCPSAGVRVSPLCLGAMSIGSAWSEFMGSMNKEQSFELLDAFFEKGGNFIDTANIYQDEESERWLGEWMVSRKNRDRIVMATKYTSDYQSHKYGKGKVVNASGSHKKNLHVSLRHSLEKLQTDYIDILYVHWWDWTTSIEEIMDALHIMVQQGKVLYLGISDSPAWVVSAANTYARAHGKTPFSIYQGRWNAIVRDLEREIIPMARHFGMALAPWDTLGQGKFKTPKEVEERKKSGETLRSLYRPDQTEDEIKISEALAKVAAEHGIESITAIALAYIFYKYPYVYPIVGGRKISHLEDNIQSLSIKLTEKQVEYLESVTSFDPGFPQTMIGPEVGETGKLMPHFTGAGHVAIVRNAQSLHRA
ncbi:aryl-alcohol dehydrogenase [Xylaria bambusicola]|uniref:aryl-alcohol dehydrogenase n=1 Tax=Xylaria bambusicola TaxID=326684 RepID=UPI002008884A|nr:aryl-alcohol dehydrogenase [Xylaria bambusicola]KAI0505326.1 aryl-alcohol dehydrogenase [Xylaria bambusicola]